MAAIFPGSHRVRPADSKVSESSTRGLPTTQVNVAYGEHERQELDFYQAKSGKPTPLMFFIHGGGWVTADKNASGNVKSYLDAVISVVSINYRYSWHAQIAGVKPPVEAQLHAAARALQFVRSEAPKFVPTQGHSCRGAPHRAWSRPSVDSGHGFAWLGPCLPDTTHA